MTPLTRITSCFFCVSGKRLWRIHQGPKSDHLTAADSCSTRVWQSHKYCKDVKQTPFSLLTFSLWWGFLLNISDVLYLGPLGHLPLWAARGALAGPSLHRSLQVSHGAEVTVDRAVQAWWKHLPTANLAKLETLPARPWALAPAARLPSERSH